MVTASLSVQELWDHIVDELHQSPQDLRACSLVCRSFVSRAQSHVFSYIRVGGNVIRLAGLLTSSPHLIPYIRHLYFENCGAESIALLHSVFVGSHVETITLKNHTFYDMPFDHSLYEELYPLCGTPICSASQRLDHIHFQSCRLFSMPEDLALPQVRRPKIRRLGLTMSEVGKALTDPAFPLDVSALTDIQSQSVTMNSLHWDLILHSRLTIRTLKFIQIEAVGEGSRDQLKTVDLAAFPSLQCVRLGEFCKPKQGKHDHPHTKMLARLPSESRLTTLGFTLFGRLGRGPNRPPIDLAGLGDDLRALETVLTEPGMHNLARVEVDVRATNIGELVRTSMSVLHARGLIYIYCDY
ncbi:hypothetical protein MVEN_00639700 [Mycena venus]|uniref:F-box domain-containing protein n=1 Tax=Mycena venus TaxID=2733690 RepID=A0A8H6YPP3_9AGAR|nr:hypothetical protein MVEN_00639700 [Mycena venus]